VARRGRLIALPMGMGMPITEPLGRPKPMSTPRQRIGGCLAVLLLLLCAGLLTGPTGM
jgi:hypothetical protein